MDIICAVVLIGLILVVGLYVLLLADYFYLVKWLKDQAPMTWEVYNRVGNVKCECDELCNQGRNCKNTR